MESIDSTSDLGEFLILDDIVTVRAADVHQVPLLAYPRPGKGVADFELFTGQNLDRFVDQATKEYIRCGCAPDQGQVIALAGPSDLDYVVSLFALSRLGYTVLLLSPRLAAPAITNLLKMTNCDTVIYPNLSMLVSNLSQAKKDFLPRELRMISMATREIYDRPGVLGEPRFIRRFDKHEERKKVAIICHSSGSTGLPKPIYQPHNRFIATVSNREGTCEFTTFPLYHSWGNKHITNTMWIRKTMYLHSATVPMTADGMVEVLQKVKPSVLHAVPYALKLLGESRKGVEAMASCSEVLYSGSQCPDSLGDYLTSKGVILNTLFGATEFGSFGSSRGRAPGDHSWNYLRILPSVRPHVYMKPIGNNTYESVFLSSLPQLVTTNSDDPPGSYHSKDIFTPHPTIPNAWKYLGRIDDRITLINGEKVLPTPIEGRIRHELLVREVVVFGIDKALPGLLVIRSEAAREMPDEEFINGIWPAIEEANANAESFSQISREMILTLPAGTEYPVTDKGSIIRAQMYRQFAEQIEEVYQRFEEAEMGTLELEGSELEQYILRMFVDDLGIQLSGPEDDFFTAGMDSLKAIQARGLLLKKLSMGGNVRKLSQNVVFESSNIAGLAKKICAIRKGEEVTDTEDVFEVMRRAIEKYSNFKPHTPGTSRFEKKVVVLTGATGSLGAHILAQLLLNDEVHRVYCLVRGENPHARIEESLIKRGLDGISSDPRITGLTSNLSDSTLGLENSTLQELKTKTTHIIHAAWAVNFNVGFSAFENDLAGLHNLIQLSLSISSPSPARFFFCSSISVALGTNPPASIPEALVGISQCSPSGYARSKWVAEQITSIATSQYAAHAHILRIGQIAGDTKLGIWNDTEAIPLIIRSALTLGKLPMLDLQCAWLPLNTLSSTILDLTFLPSPPQPIYNLLSPHPFSWTQTLLPLLKSHGLPFISCPIEEWLETLKQSASSSMSTVKENSTVKLVGYFEGVYGRGRSGEGGKGKIEFEIGKAERDSEHLRNAPDLVEGGYVGMVLERWMEGWVGKGKGL
ncbi:hypothetical protein BPAE_0121g00140 [Botrytis paeoniae]|uniref:Carrier domain-containing protein n=1 Tax=Botrytis paeoniae TaxID=278948 RepID=A0A4Z1FK87_9HELO|nr:hypothetical protein BPAE_0121g00140 [Botrytis paeoniae]